MSPEITIIVVIDTVAAISANRLEGNIYLIDNLSREGSEGNGTGQLTTAIHGAHWKDGSQANAPLLNWLIAGVGSLPPSLPRNFHAQRSRLSDAKRLRALTALSERLKKVKSESAKDVEGLFERHSKAIAEADANAGYWAKIRGNRGEERDLGLKLINMRGQIALHDKEDVDFSQLVPVLTDITGEAVDEGILYPAQYGTPITLNDGWYWSATASVHRPGVYAYTMHLRLHHLIWSDGRPIWEPKDMTYSARINVTNNAMVNGFTGGGLGYLPLVN